MNNAELLAIQPSEYLKNGFYDQDGELIEGLNGYYSLAMAYRLRDEHADIDQLKALVDGLKEITSNRDGSVTGNPKFKALRQKSISPTITAIFDAADPWVKDWKSYASLTLHLQRILNQLTLISNLPEGE